MNRAALCVVLVATGSPQIHAAIQPGSAVPAISLPVVEPNDNRASAGRLENGVLKLDLLVDSARWYPETQNGQFVDIVSFSEEGKPPQVPAPLIRVPAGTRIEAMVRNALRDSTIYLHGFGSKPSDKPDSVAVRPGESVRLSFSAGEAGTYLYHATIGAWDKELQGERTQLSGALVIDSANAPTDDRIFVINIWSGLVTPGDTTSRGNALAINGRSWPHTERITATVGDSVRWRVLNGSDRSHPMHLHGFYFRIDGRGDTRRDTLFKSDRRRLAVTEDLAAGHSMSLVMKPERAGNWLFHCHLSFHVVRGANLSDRKGLRGNDHGGHSADPGRHMSGLVLGINVKDAPGAIAERRTNVRRMKVFVQEGTPRRRAPRALGFVLQRDRHPPAIDSVEIPGSILVVNRGEPTDITVANRLKEATSIHWHGIELESYSDGVPGWSGMEKRLAPMIAPGKSFTARLTLRRAGTFIYHTHLNDIEQVTSGLYGAMVVLEPGQVFDPKTDHVFVMGWDGVGARPLVINGDTTSTLPIQIGAGKPHRFRFVNIGPAGGVRFTIRKDTIISQWRPLAKDGADLPSGQAVNGDATRRLAVGETFDAEFTAPSSGEWVLMIGPRYKRRLIAR